MRLVSTKQLYFIGVVGLPYYVSITLLILKASDISVIFLLLLIPAWYLYDRVSQVAYIKNVQSNKYGNLQYAARSLVYQGMLLSGMGAVLWTSNT